jgi:hypothetical protein
MFPYKRTNFREHKMSVLTPSNYLQESTVCSNSAVDFDLVYNVYFYKLSVKGVKHFIIQQMHKYIIRRYT